MASVRDSDISLWLHNKLGTTNDTWISGSICTQLTSDVLRNIKDCFPDLQTQVKLKLLLSFFHIPRRNIAEWRTELEEILEVACVDSEQWVSMLAEMMKTFPSTGNLNVTEFFHNEDNNRIFNDLISDLKKLVRKNLDYTMLPLECLYLNKNALINVVGQSPTSVKHFNLKRKPKAAAIKAELLQKATDAANNIKKHTAPAVPVRSRGMPRKMTDTTPLKGIPSRSIPSGGFRSNPLNNTLTTPSRPGMRKDCGIKILEITEQPIGYAQAKKRKRAEMEESKRLLEANSVPTSGPSLPNSKTEVTSTTPDYAAGLAPLNPPTPAPPTPQHVPSYIAPATPLPPEPIINEPPSVPSTPQPAVETPPAPAASKVIHPPMVQMQVRSQTAQVGSSTTTSTNTAPTQLSLTRSQMEEAQDMFRNANKVTRPEKALILGFMAGSRDNPCPQLGSLVTVKLSEDHETVLQNDHTLVNMLVETHFQMNYNTGEWKRIKKYIELDRTSMPVASSQLAALAAAATALQNQS
ncbi:negative elongation factor A [Adelges cooleyi]|uniref:negative elongation factor A n=1 Tax=Adelges cooleyi TaxID=133065 RepID=UPI0021804318|nr:negative elongation factor A [Adelges cooleyi]XP_050436016.1 negative elongation factor A [Adelges cooleyi]